MAIRLVVEYVNLQASVQFQDVVLSTETADTSAPSLSTTFADLDLQVSNQVIAPISGILLDFVNLEAGVNFENFHITTFLDSDTKNLYFYPGNPNAVVLNITEQAALDVGKALNDSLAMSEVAQIEAGKNVSDSLAITENLVKEILFTRTFSDSYGFADNQSFAFNNAKTDLFAVTELAVRSFAKATDDSFGLAEQDVKSFAAGKSDNVTIVESESYALSTPKTDSYNVTDDPAIANTLPKTDSFSVAESSVLLNSLGKTESLSVAENLERVIDFNRNFTDTPTITDSPALDVSFPNSDSYSIVDNFLRTVSYNRDFADAFAMDDQSSVTDELATDTSLVKANIISMIDSPAFALTKPNISDTFSVAESLAYSFNKTAADSVTISESIAVVVISSGSVLNTSALNTSALN